MKKIIKKVSAFMAVTSLVCSLAVPVFAEEAITPDSMGNSTKIAEISAESPATERDMLSKFLVMPYKIPSGSTAPSSQYYNQEVGGYIWKGTLNYLKVDEVKPSYTVVLYAGYVYAYEV